MTAAKTLKQAKAAYKSRAATVNPLSGREQKQLERSAALDRRACGLREREKSRANAVKKRAEKEKAEREERKKLGDEEERRRDRHGFLASQLCLGAFFGRGGFAGKTGKAADAAGEHDGSNRGDEKEQERAEENAIELDVGGDTEEEDFQDVDDDSLLAALNSPKVQRKEPVQEPQNKATGAMPPPPPPPPRRAQAQQRQPLRIRQSIPQVPALSVAQHSNPLWQDLDFSDTSTQIARELDPTQVSWTTVRAPGIPRSRLHQQKETAPQHPLVEPKKSDVCNTSFGSCGSFDFTEAELEELDPTPPLAIVQSRSKNESNKAMNDEKMLSAPTVAGIADQKLSEQKLSGQNTNKRDPVATTSMPPPALPASKTPNGRRPAGLPVKKQSSQRANMPPSALLTTFSNRISASNADMSRHSIRPPPRPASHPCQAGIQVLPVPGVYRRSGKPSTQAKGVKSVEDKENTFTLTELESFVDEDLQLTQTS